MATNTDTPEKPVLSEVARARGRGIPIGQAFVEILQTDDSVLQTRGQDYSLYRETLRDDRCASTFADRRLAVTSKEWEVRAASESPLDIKAAEFIREELHRLNWDDKTDKMLFARWYGHAVAECMWMLDGALIRLADIKVRDRGRFRYSDDGGVWLLTQEGKYERMPDRKFWTVSVGADNDDSPYGLGLGHFCYWPVFFKRNALKFWLVFVEKFGSPTAVGKLPAGKFDDDELVGKVLDALEQFATETAIVIPEETTMELVEAVRSGSGTHDVIYDRMDAAVAQLVIGQTASTQGTPGRLGNDKLQGDVRADLIKADADLVCSSFNRSVVAWLTEWNFPGAGVPQVWRKVDPDEDLKERAETDTAIAGLGYEPGEQYIRDTYGDHWTKAQPKPNPLAMLGMGRFGRGQSDDEDADPLKAANDFAEAAALSTLKAGKRADQDAIKQAATFLATRWEQTLGDRVGELLAYAEESGDFETMGRHLLDMAAELPPARAVETVHHANLFSRLLGLWRGGR